MPRSLPVSDVVCTPQRPQSDQMRTVPSPAASPADVGAGGVRDTRCWVLLSVENKVPGFTRGKGRGWVTNAEVRHAPALPTRATTRGIARQAGRRTLQDRAPDRAQQPARPRLIARHWANVPSPWIATCCRPMVCTRTAAYHRRRCRPGRRGALAAGEAATSRRTRSSAPSPWCRLA